MNEIIKILMERDDLTKEEATQVFNEGRDRILENIGDPFEVEEIMMEEFGLEMDYIMDII